MNINYVKQALGFVFPLFILSANVQAVDGTDIRIMVVQDDSNDGTCTVPYSSSAGKIVTTKIAEQFNRYGYTVVPREALAAELKFDLNQRLDKSQAIDLARKAKGSGKAEFDIKALVIYRITCQLDSTKVATDIELDVSGSVYDTEAKRELGDFGPLETRFAVGPKCDVSCVHMETKKRSGDLAILVADQGRTKLAMITKQNGKAEGSANRVVTFNIRLENLGKSATKIRNTMNKQFPGSKGITSLSGSGTLVTFGYRSTSPSDKIRDWAEVMIEDLGLTDTTIMVDGTSFTIRNNGADLPTPQKPVERIFE